MRPQSRQLLFLSMTIHKTPNTIIKGDTVHHGSLKAVKTVTVFPNYTNFPLQHNGAGLNCACNNLSRLKKTEHGGWNLLTQFSLRQSFFLLLLSNGDHDEIKTQKYMSETMKVAL